MCAFVGGSDGGGRKQEATRAFQASDDRAKQGLIPLNKRSPAPVRHLTWLHLAIDQMSRISRAAVGPCLAVWLLGTPARPSRTPHDLPERACQPPRRPRPSCSASTRTLQETVSARDESNQLASQARRSAPRSVPHVHIRSPATGRPCACDCLGTSAQVRPAQRSISASVSMAASWPRAGTLRDWSRSPPRPDLLSGARAWVRLIPIRLQISPISYNNFPIRNPLS